MKKSVKKTDATKKSKFEASPVSRKAVEAIKAKLRKQQDKRDAVKIAKSELEAEKKALQKKSHRKLTDALLKRGNKKT